MGCLGTPFSARHMVDKRQQKPNPEMPHLLSAPRCHSSPSQLGLSDTLISSYERSIFLLENDWNHTSATSATSSKDSQCFTNWEPVVHSPFQFFFQILGEKSGVEEAGRSCQIHQLGSSSSSVCGWLAAAWISSARQKSQTAWEVGGNRMEVLGTIIVIDSLTLRVPIDSIDIVIVGSNMATMAMQWLLCRISYCDLQLPERYKTSWQTTGTKRIELWWSYDGAFRRRS